MLNETDFAFIAREVKARVGVVLRPELAPLAAQRLGAVGRREGFTGADEFIVAARARGEERLWSAITDALVQSETRFFRDRELFAQLRDDTLPKLVRDGAPLRIWCAGVASGQEAYSLTMLAEEWRSEGGGACTIVASDLSERLLEKARSGLYTQFEIQRGLPIRQLIAHFEKSGDLWRIADRHRGAVRFEQHNLLHSAEALPALAGGPFDLVLCRNVLSTMDEAQRAGVLERISAVCAPQGVLVLGKGENLPAGYGGFAALGETFVRAEMAAA